MNLTLSVDEKVVERAREAARQQGTSLNALVRQYLETLAGSSPGHETASELLSLMREHGGHSGGRRIHREEAYEGRA